MLKGMKMDSRIQLLQLVEYSQLFGEKKDINDAKNLIKGIPSETLINYISGYNIHLYLKEHDQSIQCCLLNNLLNLMRLTDRKFIIEKATQLATNGPLMWFWNYTNLLFYDIVFSTFNNSPCRDLTSDEAIRFFKAYLILNEIGNNEIDIESEDFKKVEAGQENVSDLVVATFMAQRDSISNLDFRNQICRGAAFFKWIECHPLYRNALPKFYSKTGISNYTELLTSIGLIFIDTKCTCDNHSVRKQIFTITNENYPLINVKYLESLTINDSIGRHESYCKILRSKCLYKRSEDQYYILNINYLIDHFYKSQVFAFNMLTGDKNFLSNKGLEFMERIVFKSLMDETFKMSFKSYNAVNSHGEELCDYYLRNGNRVGIIEFKDVMIKDDVKKSKQKEQVFKELDIKFKKNQKGKQKGVSQLVNAAIDIILHGTSFDNKLPKNTIIYPIIVYTDNSFGVSGLNFHYNSIFQQNINNYLPHSTSQIKNVTFINLSYLEMHREYFANNILDLFNLLDAYFCHIQNEEYSMTTFEAFSRLYMSEKQIEDLPSSPHFEKTLSTLLKYSS